MRCFCKIFSKQAQRTKENPHECSWLADVFTEEEVTKQHYPEKRPKVNTKFLFQNIWTAAFHVNNRKHKLLSASVSVLYVHFWLTLLCLHFVVLLCFAMLYYSLNVVCGVSQLSKINTVKPQSLRLRTTQAKLCAEI